MHFTIELSIIILERNSTLVRNFGLIKFELKTSKLESRSKRKENYLEKCMRDTNSIAISYPSSVADMGIRASKK